MSEKLLFVDDEKNVLKSIRRSLIAHDASWELFFAESGHEALALCDEHSFDLIMTDAHMPNMNGAELLKELASREDTKDIPKLMLTGYADEEIRRSAFESGIVEYITKPFLPEELILRLSNVLKLKKLSESLNVAIEKLEKLNFQFSRFVPEQFLERIMDKNFKAGRFEREKISIAFFDIRDYTRMAESLSSEENFKFINEYYRLTEMAISKCHGFVDKFIGDGVMGLFRGENSANHAVEAAIEVQRKIQEYNKCSKSDSIPHIDVGIGINTGVVMLGALGNEHRITSTVIGDHVNLTSRIESLTKRFRSKILISSETLKEINKNKIKGIRQVDTLRVRGRVEPVTVHEIFETDEIEHFKGKMKILPLTSEGIGLYTNMKFKKALSLFEASLFEFPYDNLTYDYIKRCHYFIKYPPSSGYWNLIENDANLIDWEARRRFVRDDTFAPIEPFKILKKGGCEYSEFIRGNVKDRSNMGMSIETTIVLTQRDILFLEVKGLKVLGKVMWSYDSKEAPYPIKAGLEIFQISNTSQLNCKTVSEEN